MIPLYLILRTALGVGLSPSAIAEAPPVTLTSTPAAAEDLDRHGQGAAAARIERAAAWIARAGVLAARLPDRAPVKLELVQALEEARLAVGGDLR